MTICDVQQQPLVDLNVIRVVAVVAVVLDRCRHVIALTDGRGRIILVAVHDLCPTVVLHPIGLTARIILNAHLRIARVDPADGSVDLPRLILWLCTAAETTKYVAQRAVAGAHREKRPAHGEDS
jgi:hypothetical protein